MDRPKSTHRLHNAASLLHAMQELYSSVANLSTMHHSSTATVALPTMQQRRHRN